MREGSSARAAPGRAGVTEGEAGAPVVEHWGRVAYDDALARQVALHARVLSGEAPDTLVVVEHPATITLGRNAPEQDVVLDRAELERRGISVARSDRAGRATYHGPGQVVLYPVVSIAALGLGVKDWVCLLEGALIDTLADYGVSGSRRGGTAGIWTGTGGERGSAEDAGAKIASLGLRVVRGVSYHGVSLNTGLDASVFDCIVTCGVRGERVATLAGETGREIDDAEVAARLARRVSERISDKRRTRRAAGDTPEPS